MTGDEAQLVAGWSVQAFLTELRARYPRLSIDPARGSLLADDELGARLRDRAAAEGTQDAAAIAEKLSWRTRAIFRRGVDVTLGPAEMARQGLRRLLIGATGHGRLFRIAGEGRSLMIEPAAQSSWSARPETLVLAASPALVAALLRFLDGSETTFRDSDLPGFAITLVD